MEKKIVLAIDDEETMLDLIKKNIERIAIPTIVYGATTGEEGLEKYKKLTKEGKKPHLVLMDLNLTQWGKGRMDGVETTRKILEFDPKANIYGYTAWFATAWAKKLEEAGAKKVIERTILPADFRKLIEDILRAT